MAENKNSFVFYAEWKQDFEFLTDAEAGKLIKHLLQYVNDENPEFENEDRLLQFAAQKIKNVLKKDLKKYEEVCKKRSEAGKKGGVTSGKSRASKQSKSNEANASIPKQNEHDNEYEYEYDNDILFEKESKTVVDETDPNLQNKSDLKNLLKTEFSEKEEKTKMILTSAAISMDRWMKISNLDKDQILLKIDEFVEKKFDWEENNWQNESDLKKNFEFWLIKNPKLPYTGFTRWTKEDFFKDVQNVSNGQQISKETLQEFFDHYREPTPSGEMLFQSMKAWDTRSRLKKWLNNKKNYAART